MGKKRVSMTLDEELVEDIDEDVKQSDLNRSQKVQRILKIYYSEGSDMEEVEEIMEGLEAKAKELVDAMNNLEV